MRNIHCPNFWDSSRPRQSRSYRDKLNLKRTEMAKESPVKPNSPDIEQLDLFDEGHSDTSNYWGLDMKPIQSAE